MAWISTTNVNAARDRNSYCAPSLCCLDQTGHSEGGQKREWKIETARLRGFGYPEFYFSSMRKKKRIPTTTDKRRGYGHGARARASKKGDEGGKGEEKKKEEKNRTRRRWEGSFSKLTHIPRRSTMISAARAAHKRSRVRIIRGDFLSSTPRGIHWNEWMNMRAPLWLPPASSTELTRHADSIAASVSITRAHKLCPSCTRGHLQFRIKQLAIKNWKAEKPPRVLVAW